MSPKGNTYGLHFRVMILGLASYADDHMKVLRCSISDLNVNVPQKKSSDLDELHMHIAENEIKIKLNKIRTRTLV